MNDGLIKKNIKCISRIMLATYPAAILFMAVMLGIDFFGGESIKDIIGEIPTVVTFGNVWVLAMVSISVTAGYFPVMLSMGSGKHGFFIGKHITCIMEAVILSIFNIGIYIAVGEFKFYYCFMMLGGMLICLVIGNSMGDVLWRYGHMGYVIYVIGIMIIVVGMTMSHNLIGRIIPKNMYVSGVMALTAAIVIYMIFLVFDWKCIEKYEIR